MKQELPKVYEPQAVEGSIYQRWMESGAFHARPDERSESYVIMMPLPNVTGALHMGHAMDNVMQDLLVRWHRMRGENSLWMPGIDHAGIATQAIVEKRLFELEGKTRHDVGRQGLVERIFEWKERYENRIISQQQSMGCSCDWDRHRFTMDAVCARAVRHTFFHMFADGLIYRGNRMVNWDCHLQTAVSDDEIYYETVDGHFWHLRYPVIDPRDGEPEAVTVATTRPETMLGDTAVACHPDPAGVLDARIRTAREKLAGAGDKERGAAEAELARLEARRESHLPGLLKLVEMARDGRRVRLPLQDREMPIILDEWAKPELGSGCVKITPGHDPNDYDVWTRHADEIDSINILNEDGTLGKAAGAYVGLDRYAARERVVADLDALGLLEKVEDRLVEVGHSDRSKTAIEPFMSRQWFVHMGDVDGGIVCGRDTDKEFAAPGLAQAAMDAANGNWKSATDRAIEFHPDPVRYGNTYLNWLSEKRDWCISRQLWWGHQIPIWHNTFDAPGARSVVDALADHLERDDLCLRVGLADRPTQAIASASDADALLAEGEDFDVLVCLQGESAEGELAARLESLGLARDPDVLDTWFSSGVWPHSTLGWPDPATAQQNEGQPILAAEGEFADCLSTYCPGSCLVTGRDIITLWVARMAVMGLYNLGDVPFTDVFIHATILDGKGERMSKSKGNGIDPVDIIERYGADAMRYVICEIQTGSQDIRLPVQAISPFTGNAVDLAKAKHGQSIFTYICPESGKEFDVLGTMDDVPAAKLISERFEVGRAFCTKLLNATRFAMMNLEDAPFEVRDLASLAPEDRWILSRLQRAVADLIAQLEAYNPSGAIGVARDFFWSELCDWYLEMVKPRMRDGDGVAQQVVAHLLDQVLRLLHPFVPFITEFLWEHLNGLAPIRGIDAPLPAQTLLVEARWPQVNEGWVDAGLEARFATLQEWVRVVREIRSTHNVPLSRPVEVRVRTSAERAAEIGALDSVLRHLANLESLEVGPDVERTADSAAAVSGDVEIYVLGAVDLEKERERLAKQRDALSGRIQGTEKKLANPGFCDKAPAAVVERERAKLDELRAELAGVETNLAALGG